MGEALDWWDRFEKTQTALEAAPKCAAAGLGSDACADAVWAGACTLFTDLGLAGAAPHFQFLGLPFDKLCAGEPRLKCCKYTADQIGCHTAFNQTDPPPINCDAMLFPMGRGSAPSLRSCGSPTRAECGSIDCPTVYA